MKKTKRKLALDKQTVIAMTPDRLSRIAGGNLNGPDNGTDPPNGPCSAWQCRTLVSCPPECPGPQ